MRQQNGRPRVSYLTYVLEVRTRQEPFKTRSFSPATYSVETCILTLSRHGGWLYVDCQRL